MNDNEEVMVSSAYRDHVMHICGKMRDEIKKMEDSKLVDSDSTYYRQSLTHKSHKLLNDLESTLCALTSNDYACMVVAYFSLAIGIGIITMDSRHAMIKPVIALYVSFYIAVAAYYVVRWFVAVVNLGVERKS